MKAHKMRVVLVIMLVFCVIQLFGINKVYALESAALPMVENGKEIVAVELPIVNANEESPFDFFIDPQGLLYETDAVAHGGGIVERDAHLLFHNKQKDNFDFSRNSDRLTVTNRSTVPVIVTITAQLTDIGEMKISQDKDFTDDESCSIYLALVDDDGNEQPVSETGEVSISVEMKDAPQNVYSYNEETGIYEYGQIDENASFDTYSFGLTGECNADADWANVRVHPMIKVTWQVEPVMPEKTDVTNEELSGMDEEQHDIDVSGNTFHACIRFYHKS